MLQMGFEASSRINEKVLVDVSVVHIHNHGVWQPAARLHAVCCLVVKAKVHQAAFDVTIAIKRIFAFRQS